MTGFVFGFVIGAALTCGAVFFIFARLAHAGNKQRIKRSNYRDSLELKVENSLRYFGLIANRDSINEARKIANKAIKEIGETQ